MAFFVIIFSMIIAFLLFTGLYYILNTFFVYAVCWFFSCTNFMHDIFFLLRDLLWIILVLFYIIKNIRLLKNYFIANKYIYLTFFLILIGNLVVSRFNWINFLGMVVWFKYAYFHLYIFLSASLLGFLVSKVYVDDVFKKFFSLFFVFILVWLLFDICKFFTPDLFINFLWFWPVWDYVLWNNPPVYYRTWPWWIMRLSWLWAWPNNYGFLLIWLTPLFLSNSSVKLRQRLLVSFVWLWTLSRALIVWLVSELILFAYTIRNKLSRLIICIIIWVVWFLTILVWYLSFFKSTSTWLHISRRYEAFLSAIHHPFGIWLWQSGPAVHWGWKLLPENFYLQLSIEWWIAMLLLYCLFWYLIYRKSYFNWTQSYLYRLWIGFAGMSVAWMFLHVFEDSMTNYRFFVLFWLAWWNNLHKK